MLYNKTKGHAVCLYSNNQTKSPHLRLDQDHFIPFFNLILWHLVMEKMWHQALVRRNAATGWVRLKHRVLSLALQQTMAQLLDLPAQDLRKQ